MNSCSGGVQRQLRLRPSDRPSVITAENFEIAVGGWLPRQNAVTGDVGDDGDREHVIRIRDRFLKNRLNLHGIP